MIDDIEDDYPDYLDDERGYSWQARDGLRGEALEEMLRHDQLVESSEAALDAIDPSSLNDLLKWGYARGCKRRGDIDAYLEAAQMVADSEANHVAIAYDEVYEALVEALADNGQPDEADLLIERFATRWPDDTRATRLRVYVGTRGPDLAERLATARTALGDDVERMFEIAEDLHRLGSESCRGWLDEVETAARAQGLRAILLDIALLRDEFAPTE